MKALVLAGGAGTRLRPITHTSAKQLVPVANKPILFYGLEQIAEAGITEVGLIVGDTAEEMHAAVGDGSQFGLKITYIPQDEPLGLAHCVLIARNFLGDDDFVMYLGDNLLRHGVKEFVEQFESERQRAATPTLDDADGRHRTPSAQILLARVPDPERFGVAEVDVLGEVVNLVEKPEDPPSDLALVGVYLFDKTIHRAVAELRPSARGELEITEAIQWLIDHGHRVRHQVLEGWWKDTGQRDALLQGNQLMLEAIEARIDGEVDAASRIDGRVVVEAGASVVRSRVLGPAIIGAGTRIVDSYVGPSTAIAERCEITSSEIEHSIVLADSTLQHVGRLVDSIIGRHVRVTRSELRPRATRLMVGDNSQVDLT